MKKYFILIGVIAIILVISLISAAWFTGKAVWNWNWCSPSNKCPAGEGDCDSNNDCKTGYCSHDVGQKYGQTKIMDVCECKSEETFYEGKCLTNDCYTLVSNIIEILNKNSQGVKCGDSNYKAVYDIDKDGYIVPKDSLIVTNKMSPDWCSERLKDTFDVCNSGEGSDEDNNFYTKAEVDAKLGALKGTCQYIHYKDSIYTGYNLNDISVMDVCQKILGGFVPKIIVETESRYLHNKQNCSSSYQIYGKTADNLISYKTELAGVKLGQSTSNACDNAVFPDGSSNAGFSTKTYRLYSGVLCCKN